MSKAQPRFAARLPFDPTKLSYFFLKQTVTHVNWCNVNITLTQGVTKHLSPKFWKNTWLRTPSAHVDTDLQRQNDQATVEIFQMQPSKTARAGQGGPIGGRFKVSLYM